jgi:hypothetical protein
VHQRLFGVVQMVLALLVAAATLAPDWRAGRGAGLGQAMQISAGAATSHRHADLLSPQSRWAEDFEQELDDDDPAVPAAWTCCGDTATFVAALCGWTAMSRPSCANRATGPPDSKKS